MIKQQICVQFDSSGLKSSRELQVQICEHQKVVNFNAIETDLGISDKQNLVLLLSEFRDHFVIGVPNKRVTTGQLVFRLRDPTKFVQRTSYRLAPAEREIFVMLWLK